MPCLSSVYWYASFSYNQHVEFDICPCQIDSRWSSFDNLKARIECQNHRLIVDYPVTKYIMSIFISFRRLIDYSSSDTDHFEFQLIVGFGKGQGVCSFFNYSSSSNLNHYFFLQVFVSRSRHPILLYLIR